MVEIYGADAARLFVLFAAPVDNELVWHESGIEGAIRFLQRVWRFVYRWRSAFESFRGSVAGNPVAIAPGSDATAGGTDISRRLRQKTHQTIKRVDDSLSELHFNTPVAGLMELINALYESKLEPETATVDEKFAVYEATRSLVLMLAPFAPHTAEELYEHITGETGGMIASGARYPEYRAEFAVAAEIEIAVQVNGKLRSRIMASPDATNAELEEMALADEKVKEFSAGKAIVKVIVVPKRLVNVVVK
jgi:leucyl-tRNA synthetase